MAVRATLQEKLDEIRCAPAGYHTIGALAGLPFYAMLGAEKGDEEDEDDDSEDDDSEEEDTGSEGQKKSYTPEEYEGLRRRMQAADKAKSKAEKALREKQLAEKGELDRAKTETADAVKAKEGLEHAVEQLRLHNAFLSSNAYTWHDPEDALRLADLSDVEIDDDGKVHGLEEAIKKLATKKPHLLKAKGNRKTVSDDEDDTDDGDDNSDEDEDDTPNRNGKPASGSSVGSGKSNRGKPKKFDADYLRKTYPALR